MSVDRIVGCLLDDGVHPSGIRRSERFPACTCRTFEPPREPSLSDRLRSLEGGGKVVPLHPVLRS